jgi:hypothetical protein
MVVSFSPEFMLAAVWAMWPPSEQRADAIRGAADRPIDEK